MGAVGLSVMSLDGKQPVDRLNDMRHLAHTLRHSIDTAREVANLRPDDSAAIEAVARQMEGMLALLDAMMR